MDNTEALPEPVDAPEPAPAPPPPEATTDTPAQEPAPPPPPERDDKGRFQRRVDDLTRSKGEAEREAAYWRTQALASKPTPAPEPQGKPTSDKYANYEEFVEALSEWKANETWKSNESKRQQTQERETAAKTWKQSEAEFVKATPDYREVVGSSDIALPQYILDSLARSATGPQLAYHLAKNPDVAERIAGLPQGEAMMELGELRASLKSAAAPAPPPAARTTNAPPPIRPVSQGASGTGDPSKMSMDEYMAWRKGQPGLKHAGR